MEESSKADWHTERFRTLVPAEFLSPKQESVKGKESIRMVKIEIISSKK
jgi:hypothetical protein